MSKVRTIRTDLAKLLTDAGYKPTSTTYELLGVDKGSKVDRSFASKVMRRDYQGRHGGACRLVLLDCRVRVLIQRKRDGETASGYDVDDAVDALVDIIESWDGTGYSTRVESADVAPHSRLPSIEVVTITTTVTTQSYRSGT